MGLIFNGNGDVIKAVDGSLTVEGLDLGGGSNIVAGIATFSGNVNVGGVLTYEDVKNVDSVGIVTARDHIKITSDNKSLYLGASDDFQLFHNGSHNIIKSNNGNLYLQDDSYIEIGHPNGTVAAGFIPTGATNLRYNGSTKLATTSSGITVTGGVTASAGIIDSTLTAGRVVYTDSDKSLLDSANLTFDGNTLALNSSTGTINVSRNSRTLTLEGNYGNEGHPAVKTSSGHDLRIFTSGNNERLRINSSGELISYNGTLRRDVSDSSFTVSGDTASNTGANINLYGASHGSLANVFRVRTGSTERLRIASDGKISIGTGTARQLLHLNVADSGAANIVFTNTTTGTSAGDGFIIGITGAEDGQIWHQESANIKFGTGDTERLRIHSTGVVQIGDSTASSLSDRLLQIGKNNRSATYLELRSSSTGVVGLVLSDGTSGDAGYRGTIEYNHTSDAMFFKTAATEKLRITSTGYVGVKRSTPLANLHVTNNELAIGANPTSAAAPNATYDGLVVDGEAGTWINMRSSGDGSAAYGRLAFSDDVRGRGYLQYNHEDGNGDDVMLIATAGAERLRIDSGGRILIGSTQLLDSTAGTIHIDGGTSGGRLALRGTTTSAGGGIGEIFAFWNTNKVAGIIALAGHDTTNKDNGHLTFYTRPDLATGVQERVRIDSSGNLIVNKNNARSHAVIILSKADAGYAKLEFDVGTSQKAYIELDASEDLVHYGASGVGQMFYTGGAVALRIDSSGRVRTDNGTQVSDFDVTRSHSTITDVMLVKGNAGNGFIRFQDNDSTCNWTMGVDDGSGIGANGFIWYDRVNSAYRLSLDNSGNLKVWTDGGRLKIGAGDDLQIYHDTSGINLITCANNHHLKVSAQSFQVYEYTGVTQYFRVKSGDDRVRVYGEAAVDGTSSGADGLSIAYNGGTSCPLYFGTETDVAQKSMYLKGYWIYLRGHVNEGMKFIFSQGGAAPHGNVYEFKYNSAKRPGSSTTWDGFSDSRAKENVQSITNGIEKIKQLRPVTYDWTDEYADSTGMWKMDKSDPKEYNWVSKKENGYDTDAKTGQYGFLAQEYETVLPKDVKKEKFKLGDTEISDFRTLNHDSLIATLTAALKEAIAKIETLESEVAALKGS